MSKFTPKFEIDPGLSDDVKEIVVILTTEYVNLRNTPVPTGPGKKAGRTKQINDLSDGIAILDPSLKSVFTHVTSDKNKTTDTVAPSTRTALDIARDLIQKDRDKS